MPRPNNETFTGHFFDLRVFEGPDAEKAAHAFAIKAGEQVGMTLDVHEANRSFETKGQYASIDMTGWPKDVMFGSWFETLMAEIGVRIDD